MLIKYNKRDFNVKPAYLNTIFNPLNPGDFVLNENVAENEENWQEERLAGNGGKLNCTPASKCDNELRTKNNRLLMKSLILCYLNSFPPHCSHSKSITTAEQRLQTLIRYTSTPVMRKCHMASDTTFLSSLFKL